MKKFEKIEHSINKRTSLAYIIVGSVCVVLIGIILIFNIHNASEKYLVDNGDIENIETTIGYVVKDEKIIEKNVNKVLVPVVPEGSKVAKNGILATYKGLEYANYEEKLLKMDKEILELMKDLPTVYSSEVETIEKNIYQNLKSSINETSYIKMQEYKTKIDSSMNNRAIIIGNLSPEGADIKGLIEKRNDYEQSAKESNDNILAPMTGIVSYKTDGYEGKVQASNIDKLTYEDIKSRLKEAAGSTTDVKVVNNYTAYIVTKVSLKNLSYIKEGKTYKLRLIENSNYELQATITKFVEKDDGVEVFFQVTNGIEKLINLRDIDVDVVWWTNTGLFVTNDALNKYDKVDAYYVSVIKYGEYDNIPVKIVKQNDKYSIISNYSTEEISELGLKRKNILKQYDRIVLKSNK